MDARHDGPEPLFLARVRRVSLSLAILVAALGCVVIAGWLFGISELTSVLPGLATMKVNTALLFAAVLVTAWTVSRRSGGRRAQG